HPLVAGDDVQQRAQGAGGRHRRAGDKRIGRTGSEHHRRKVGGVHQVVAGFLLVKATEAAQALKTVDEGGHLVAVGGVDNADAVELYVKLGGVVLNFGAVAKQDRYAQPARGVQAGGLNDTGVSPFGVDHALRVVLQANGEVV